MAVYDPIAEAYRDSKQLPFRRAVERYTLFRLLGDVRGSRVLDLACGEGHYTRLIRQAGAAEVTGVDISSAMVRLAKDQERRAPLGCRFSCQDVADFEPAGEVDLVVAMYLFHYAGNREKLMRFCRVCRKALRPGGRIVGFLDNVSLPPDGRTGKRDFRKYGFEKRCEPPRPDGPEEGDGIWYRFVGGRRGPFEFCNTFLRPETYEEAFAASGFTSFRWEGVFLRPEERGNPFWGDFLAAPPVTAFTAG